MWRAALRIQLGWHWLLLLPLGLYVLRYGYVPIMGPGLGEIAAWVAAIAGMLGIVASAVLHGAAQLMLAYGGGHRVPNRLPIYLTGDAAQVWPLAPTARAEALVAAVGPLVRGALALAAYLVWDRQLHPVLSVVMLLLAIVNLSVAVINLAPGYPFDGGRLTRAIVWRVAGNLDHSSTAPWILGWGCALTLVGWGIVLAVQQARFGREAGGAIVLAGLGLGVILARQPRWQQKPVEPPRTSRLVTVLRQAAAAVLIAGLWAVAAMLAPTLHGLQAPGFAEPVEPMVLVPEPYYFPSAGRFVLTTVVTQTPIVAGQWVYAQLDDAYLIVPPEQIVPPGLTPQEIVSYNRRLLDESTLTAMIVGLRLAGYEPQIIGEAVLIEGITSGSPAAEVLETGDRIVEVEGRPVRTLEELVAQLARFQPADTISLRIERGHESLNVEVRLTEPAQSGGPPRLGINARTVGFDAVFPFDIRVDPHKIIGGPSAGLMFTLTVYDLTTPGDLTQGHIIAGTGTISLDGRVGPIGGVAQKVVGAEHSGARYFLVPRENYTRAAAAASDITVVPVGTVEDALTFLRTLPPAGEAQTTP